MKRREYKSYKETIKESLRVNIPDIKVLLTAIGEITIRELVKEHKSY